MGSVHRQVLPDAESRLVLRSRLGAITLVLLCAVQFLDIADSAIVNVALPSIQQSLHFSQQNLQWVASGYILTYGGFLLLGGRLSDLLGRRRMLFIGLTVFSLSSLTAGFSHDAGLLVAARLVQGIGAALMAPAALSELTASFRDGKDRNAALGIWGAVTGMAAAAGVFLGGVISQGPGWRWIFFVNPPIAVVVAVGAVVLLAKDTRGRVERAAFDSQGAALVTGGMLLLVYSLVRAPVAGWGSAQTIGTLAGAGVLLIAFVFNEIRSSNPLVPIAVLKVKGLVAADLTELIAFTGFFSMFFYGTLYMQEILHYSPLKAGRCLPADHRRVRHRGRPHLAAGDAHRHAPRGGGRCLIAGVGIYYVARVPLHGSYVTDLLPGFLVMSLGAGSVFVSVTTAANAGVPNDKAGLAAGLLNSSQQVGSALGLAILSAVAITRTNHLTAAHASHAVAADAGYHQALLIGAIVMAAAALLALRIGNTRQAAPIVMVSTEPEPAAAAAQAPAAVKSPAKVNGITRADLYPEK